MVYGLWFMVYGLWFMVYGLWFMVYGLWFMVYGLWIQLESTGFNLYYTAPPKLLKVRAVDAMLAVSKPASAEASTAAARLTFVASSSDSLNARTSRASFAVFSAAFAAQRHSHAVAVQLEFVKANGLRV
jgi:hypothetical protein